jgi:sugar (pentulose or hexulose) kinase
VRGGFLLGLDWGGGGVRALLLDAESGACLVRARRVAPLPVPGTGGFGWDVDLEGGLRALGEAVREALAAAASASATWC